VRLKRMPSKGSGSVERVKRPREKVRRAARDDVGPAHRGGGGGGGGQDRSLQKAT
jgi:hypothetical protein